MTMANDRGDKKIKIYAVCALVMTALVTVLRACCLLCFYDEEIGYYTRDALPLVFHILCAVSALFFASTFVSVNPSTPVSDGKEDNLIVRIASAIAAFAFVGFFVASVLSTSLVAESVAFDLLSKLSALMAIVYFAMNVFAPDANRTSQTVLGFGIVIWGVCVLAITYFDIYVQLNSPDKVILHLALLSVMALFVSEFRCFVDTVKGNLYLFSAMCAVFFSGVASIPSLLKWLIGGMESYKYLSYDAVLLALFVYSVARLLSFAFVIDRRCLSHKDEESTESEI